MCCKACRVIGSILPKGILVTWSDLGSAGAGEGVAVKGLAWKCQLPSERGGVSSLKE